MKHLPRSTTTLFSLSLCFSACDKQKESPTLPETSDVTVEEETLAPSEEVSVAPIKVTKVPEEPAELGSEPISLFDGKSTTGWERLEFGGSGDVRVDLEQLIIDDGEMLSGVVLEDPSVIPLAGYEISITAQRIRGTDFFCGLTFPVGDLSTCATLIVGGWGGGVTGISSINRLDASENNTTEYRAFNDGQWYHIRLRVHPDRLTMWLDEEELFDEDIRESQIALRPGDIDLCAPFGLATFQSEAAFKDFTLRPLTSGEGSWD